MKIFVETDRLIMRELLPVDDSFIFELDRNSEVHRYLGNNPITTLEKAKEIIEFIRMQYVSLGIGRWAVVEKKSGNCIGWSGLKLVKEPINNHIDFYDLGYRFLPAYWGKGYATEAALASVDYGFNTLKATSIYAIADERNQDSKNVITKVGLKYIESFLYEGLPHAWFELHRKS